MRLNSAAQCVGQHALHAITRDEAYLALIEHKEYQQTVIAILLANAPLLEQRVRKLENVSRANRPHSHNSNLGRALLTQRVEHTVDTVNRLSRQYPIGITRKTTRVGDIHIRNIVERARSVCLSDERGRQESQKA